MNLIDELTAIQDAEHYLSDDSLRALAQREDVPLSQIEAVASFYPHFRRTPPPLHSVSVCRDVSCLMRGGESAASDLAQGLAHRDDVEFGRVSCLGRCDAAPACVVDGVPTHATDVMDRVAAARRVTEAASAPTTPTATRHWQIDPYEGAGERYGALRDALSRDRWSTETDAVIGVLKESGLRGMGGAGFSTGLKWELVQREASETKYVICNADESEPGTFKDRVILEQLPHLVIEGLILAARCVGASQGWVYIRHEYERERQLLQTAIDAAYREGVLGDRVCGTDFAFDLRIFVSPGGYILGEETALLEALEGRRGEPRTKPPYPGVSGLYGCPTLINNVETLANVPRILRTGKADLKFFSVSGDINEPGVHEVPLGTKLRELVELCGGMRDGVELQAFLPGGASTGFLGADRADVALDWESLREAGSALGSGAVVIVGQGSNLLTLARNLTAFFRNESCGKCVPCRIGTEHAVKLLDGASSDLLGQLEPLHQTLKDTSLCGLGHVALVPAMSVLERFSGASAPDSERSDEEAGRS